jgi:hypothetical protein
MAESPTMEVRARLSADSAQFTQGMDKAVKSANEFQQASSKLQSSLTAIGVASGRGNGRSYRFWNEIIQSTQRLSV